MRRCPCGPGAVCDCAARKNVERAKRRAARDSNRELRRRLQSSDSAAAGGMGRGAHVVVTSATAAGEAFAGTAARTRRGAADDPESNGEARSSEAARAIAAEEASAENENSPPAVFEAPVSQTQGGWTQMPGVSQCAPSQDAPARAATARPGEVPWDETLRRRVRSLRVVDVDDPWARLALRHANDLAVLPYMYLGGDGRPLLRAAFGSAHAAELF